jgi:hypothetical protein
LGIYVVFLLPQFWGGKKIRDAFAPLPQFWGEENSKLKKYSILGFTGARDFAGEIFYIIDIRKKI